MKAGALGMSTNLLDHDSKDRPVPSLVADDAELGALMDVLARYPNTTLQVIVDYFMRFTGAQSSERIANLAKGRKVRIQIAGTVPTLEFQSFAIPDALKAHEDRKAAGLDIWAGYHHLSATITISFISSLGFAQSNNYVWHEIISAKTEEEKFALLSDPDWRTRARESWDQTIPQSPLGDPTQIELFDTETGVGPVGIYLSDYMKSIGKDHASDALAEWLLANGSGANLRLKDWPNHNEALTKLLLDPMSVGNTSDSGAHGKMFCGVGDNVLLLTKYVRDDKQLTIEQAVHILTGKQSNFFGLHDRGTLEVGKVADITVFNLDEIERRAETKAYDVPDGEGGRTFRYTRAPAPMRLTMVNGVPTFDRGAFTGHFPGQFIGPVGLRKDSLEKAA